MSLYILWDAIMFYNVLQEIIESIIYLTLSWSEKEEKSV